MMKHILHILFIFAVLSFLSVPAALGETYCFRCHSKAAFTKKVVHKPVAQDKCGICHNPHVARYKGLLQKKVADLCISCHQTEDTKSVQAQEGVTHEPVKDGQCLTCHDPHSSDAKGLLNKKNLADTCLGCHKSLQKKYKYTHSPYAKGECDSCHLPHRSANLQLLKKPANDLCKSCHSQKDIQARHKNFPVKINGCLTCHDPHGSESKALVRKVLHKPFAENACNTCHTKDRMGMKTCLGCHENIKKELSSNHNHLTGRTGNVCIVCHSPHAGNSDNLLIGGRIDQICRKCHIDTFKEAQNAPHKHPKSDECTNCHAIHGSNQLAMMKSDGNAVCESCHETQGKFTHPIGNKVIDPRNGQMVSCVSCHYPHGTQFKYNLKFDGAKDLCVHCHRSY